MANLTRSQVGGVLRELGFKETETAGTDWFWYEYPTLAWRDTSKPVARVQFYQPSSELQCWIYFWGRVGKHYEATENVYYESNVRTLAQQLIRARLVVLAQELARPPPELVEVALEDEGGANVLRSWLMDRGVDPF